VEEARLNGRPEGQPDKPKSAILSVEDEAVVVAFRRQTLLPLDAFTPCSPTNPAPDAASFAGLT